MLVVSDKQIRIQRVINRDKSAKEDVLQRIKKQLSDEEKIKLSSYIINNNEIDLLIPQVENILKKVNYSSESSSSSSSSSSE